MFPTRTGDLCYLATSKSSVVPHRTIVSNPNGRPLLFSLINDGGQFRPQKVSNPNGRPLLFSQVELVYGNRKRVVFPTRTGDLCYLAGNTAKAKIYMGKFPTRTGDLCYLAEATLFHLWRCYGVSNPNGRPLLFSRD